MDDQKTDYERQRLLYVAATRAKQRLYLFDYQDKPQQGSFRFLLKQQTFDIIHADATPDTETNQLSYPTLFHLPIAYYAQTPVFPEQHINTASLVINTNHTPRLIGIVAHELLQWICDNHPTNETDIPWTLAENRLKTMGLDFSILDLVKSPIIQLFNDPVGRWIIQAHDREQNEYALLTQDNQDVATRIIDRTFYENGVRWIIDFKTGQDDASKQSHHRQQVEEYATLLSDGSETPIRCGLYYLSSGVWVDWEYAHSRNI